MLNFSRCDRTVTVLYMKSSGFYTLIFQFIIDLYFMFIISFNHWNRYFLYTLLAFVIFYVYGVPITWNTKSKAMCDIIATNNPRFQNIHPNVEPVIKFPIIVTLIVKGVNSTKFLDNGRWISPKNIAEIMMPIQIVLFDGLSTFFKNWIIVIISDINPNRNIISSLIPAENDTRA